MNKYLGYLDKFNPFYMGVDYGILIGLMRRYIKGSISSLELINSIPEELAPVFFLFLNRILTFDDKKYKFFIELPIDMNFNTVYTKAIISGRVYFRSLMNDVIRSLGPKIFKDKVDFFNSNLFMELEGNFNDIPNGVLLTKRDYIKIISRWKGLYDYLENTVDFQEDECDSLEFRRKVNNIIDFNLKNSLEEIDTNEFIVTDEFLNSMRFISDKIIIDLSVNYLLAVSKL